MARQDRAQQVMAAPAAGLAGTVTTAGAAVGPGTARLQTGHGVAGDAEGLPAAFCGFLRLESNRRIH
jgi:hypothetical protein